ncbi:MAG: hypothetical protein CM15mP66_09510 [Pseudomonadota bacterium]|nr:MAG: hypothetical protein CM15mP66_09510 [Pseudomonadota bacterium]
MRININTSAVNTHRIMTQNSQRQDKNLERLASGLKINRGAMVLLSFKYRKIKISSSRSWSGH